MRNESAEIIGEALVKGALDVFDAMLSLTFTHEMLVTAAAEPDAVREYINQNSLVMRALLPSGGGLALLFSVADAAHVVALIGGGGVKAELDEQDMATLREIAEPCLGSGVTNLMEKFARAVEQPNNVSVELVSQDKAGELCHFLGDKVTSALFAFSAEGEFESASGVMLFSDILEELVPPNMFPQTESERLAEELTGGAQLSAAEMNDILSGFSTEDLPPPPPPPLPPLTPRHAPKPPTNLDMILDIRLVATARLGRVEMPIGDILGLGPGSIIDVGHLVDEPVELLVNNKLIARGDVVVVDEKFGLRITEIVSPKERIESMH